MRLAIAALLALCGTTALAHDFYSLRCCSGIDCAPIESRRVQVVEGGFLVDGKHFKKQIETEVSPDGAYHACFPAHLRGALGCLYVPPMGS
jgi:hypothetical protein